MKYPCLIQKNVCTTNIAITIYGEGLSETGAPLIVAEEDLCGNYQDIAKTVLTKEKKEVQITGIAYFRGDIAPKVAIISSGVAVVHGEKRTIAAGMKARNPDGSVNYCRLELL